MVFHHAQRIPGKQTVKTASTNDVIHAACKEAAFCFRPFEAENSLRILSLFLFAQNNPAFFFLFFKNPRIIIVAFQSIQALERTEAKTISGV